MNKRVHEIAKEHGVSAKELLEKLRAAGVEVKAASSNVLRFKIDGALPAEFEGKARVTGRIVQLPAHDAHEIEQYLAAIRQAGLRVEDVEIRKADLEDVFLDVMSEKAAA